MLPLVLLTGQALAFSCTRKAFAGILPKGGYISYVETVAQGGSFTDPDDGTNGATNLPSGCALGLSVPTSPT